MASDSTENLVNLMSGAQEIELTVKGDSEQAKALISEITDVVKPEVQEAQEDGASAFLITAAKNSDIREALFYKFAKNQMPILRMQAVVKSLEDVFLELTQEGGQN